jgi:hypothetical protein
MPLLSYPLDGDEPKPVCLSNSSANDRRVRPLRPNCAVWRSAMRGVTRKQLASDGKPALNKLRRPVDGLLGVWGSLGAGAVRWVPEPRRPV